MFSPSPIKVRIAATPLSVPGTLTIRFSRPTAFQSRRASATVSSVRSAK